MTASSNQTPPSQATSRLAGASTAAARLRNLRSRQRAIMSLPVNGSAIGICYRARAVIPPKRRSRC